LLRGKHIPGVWSRREHKGLAGEADTVHRKAFVVLLRNGRGIGSINQVKGLYIGAQAVWNSFYNSSPTGSILREDNSKICNSMHEPPRSFKPKGFVQIHGRSRVEVFLPRPPARF
jgi:hypothetical protein